MPLVSVRAHVKVMFWMWIFKADITAFIFRLTQRNISFYPPALHGFIPYKSRNYFCFTPFVCLFVCLCVCVCVCVLILSSPFRVPLLSTLEFSIQWGRVLNRKYWGPPRPAPPLPPLLSIWFKRNGEKELIWLDFENVSFVLHSG